MGDVYDMATRSKVSVTNVPEPEPTEVDADPLDIAFVTMMQQGAVQMAYAVTCADGSTITGWKSVDETLDLMHMVGALEVLKSRIASEFEVTGECPA
jgi:hypothetical protein